MSQLVDVEAAQEQGFWCPICGSKMSHKIILGVRVLWCPRHKVMQAALTENPLVELQDLEAVC